MYIKIVKEIYREAETKVRSTMDVTDSFEVKVGLHQYSALSPVFFNVVSDMMIKTVRENPPWYVMHADDVILLVRRKTILQKKLEL